MILYRTQGSAEIGFGHIKRSVYLASLIKKKNNILFVLKKDKAAVTYIKESGFDCIYSKQINGVDWEKVSGIIFDIRTIDSEDNNILKEARSRGVASAQITDLNLSLLETDIVFNASIDVKKGKIFSSNIDYTVLHNKFIHFNKVKRRYKKKLKNILISLGGGVQYRQLRNIIEILYKQNYSLKITSGFYLKRSSRKILKRIYPKIKFVGKVESLARPLFETDIAVITAGTTSYEAASVGTPAIYFYYNDEQKSIAKAMENAGMGKVISNISNIDKALLIDTIKRITIDDRESMGKAGKKMFDGKGIYRIIEKLKENGVIE